MTKKRSSENLAGENQKFFLEKVKLGKFPTNMRNFWEKGRKSETGGNASLPQGGWTPLSLGKYRYILYFTNC